MNMLPKWAKVVIPAALIVAGINTTLAKSSIKNLTSKKKSKSVERPSDQGSHSSSSHLSSQIPSELKKHSLGIGVGQTFVAGDFADHGENKITWDLLYNYSASHSFDLLTSFHISKHRFRQTYSRLMGLTMGIKAKLFQFDSFSPYALGGFGFYSPKVRREIDGVLTDSESKIAFGYNIGAGGDLRLNEHMSVGLLAQYHNPFDVKQDIGTEVEGRYYKLLITTFYTF